MSQGDRSSPTDLPSNDRGRMIAETAGYAWIPAGSALAIPMVYVPPGEFVMGSKDGDASAWPDERPQHRRRLDGYWIGLRPVTVLEYATYCDATGARRPAPSPGEARGAVTSVSAYEADAFAAWAGLALPTEAEWEKAARGADGRVYAWGDQWESDREKRAVIASPCGALDMSGVVWQWTSDDYTEDAYAAPRAGSTGAAAGTPSSTPAFVSSRRRRVLRGGSWLDNPRRVRAAFRDPNDPGNRYDFIGFRLVAVRGRQDTLRPMAIEEWTPERELAHRRARHARGEVIVGDRPACCSPGSWTSSPRGRTSSRASGRGIYFEPEIAFLDEDRDGDLLPEPDWFLLGSEGRCLAPVRFCPWCGAALPRKGRA